MRSWTRELLFAAEVPEATIPSKSKPTILSKPTGEPRLWQSWFDIPRGTLVLPAAGQNYLYVTTRGLGWWMTPNSTGQFPEIAMIERTSEGWPLHSQRGDSCGPFLEVFR